MEEELEWARSSPKGRHSKAKARLTRYEELQAGQPEERREELEIYIPPGPRLGNVVVEFDGVSKSFGDRTLFRDLSFSLPPGGIVGIIGPNGAGKTTLFRMITGHETPDTGTVRIGDTVQLGYVHQDRPLDPAKTVWEEVSDKADFIKLGNREINSRAYLGRFNFTGPDQQKLVGDLSGGERGRLHLAKTLKEGANVLLLDEPSNDLDVNTLRALEEGLLAFGGCAAVISHDRWFLDRVATHILAFEDPSEYGGDGAPADVGAVVRYFPGNFSEYEEDRRTRLGERADATKRTYRRLTRA
jgi:ATPase subunit of ABC transporter with duplicated ATPase domains